MCLIKFRPDNDSDSDDDVRILPRRPRQPRVDREVIAVRPVTVSSNGRRSTSSREVIAVVRPDSSSRTSRERLSRERSSRDVIVARPTSSTSRIQQRYSASHDAIIIDHAPPRTPARDSREVVVVRPVSTPRRSSREVGLSRPISAHRSSREVVISHQNPARPTSSRVASSESRLDRTLSYGQTSTTPHSPPPPASPVTTHVKIVRIPSSASRPERRSQREIIQIVDSGSDEATDYRSEFERSRERYRDDSSIKSVVRTRSKSRSRV